MKWIRYEEGLKTVYQGMGIVLVFFLLSFIYSQVMLAACFAAVFAMFSFQNIYYSKVGKNLIVLPLRNRTRFLIGTENDLILEFENGKIPIWNGTLTLSIQDAVAPMVDDMDHFSGIFDFHVPFAVGSGEKVKVSIPLQGRKRGMARITRMTIKIPYLFGDGSVLMELAEPIRQENLVYPKILPFTGKLNPSPHRPGETEQHQGLFHDVFQPVGTRDYIPADRFDQIHWKASARMQKLQTKEFQAVTALSVLFIMNAIEKPRSPGDFEKKIERLASYVDYCTRNTVTYSIVINIQTFGVTPYVYIPLGAGKIRYQKIMEILARLSEKNGKIPYESILRSVDLNVTLPPTIVLITHDPELFGNITKKWLKYNHVVIDSFYDGRKEGW
ncbi:DUF58 domain-containing protein [Sporosarcina limicola]|uniref:Uncharacterized protein (DUF58 family) n=1 Tax=Sporosarcina limicola TaxID=34101 RepID=A0A927MFH7_9BACL|nr:DUF58 domain-containing protein [Sporosarcina limicola]MBE1553640.1 uncharacterized protein (DUF58 family) [Sporosarcina limicola]